MPRADRTRLALCTCLLCCTALARAQDATVTVGGYVKDLPSYATGPAGCGWDNLVHARLNLRWYIDSTFSAALETRARAYAGRTVETTPGFLDLIRAQHDLARLDAVLWNGRSSVGYAEIDRAWVEMMTGPWQVTLGRQRVAWGTNLVWNLIDIFNPYNVLDFDYEERPGVDVLRAQWYPGTLSRVEAVVKPGTTGATSTVAAAVTTNRWDYDFHLVAGQNDRRWVAGAAWAGDLWGAGFRGEATYTELNVDLRQRAMLDPSTPSTAWAAAISADYTFPSSLYLHGEGLYNELGVTHDAALFRASSMALGLRSPARWSVFGEVAYDVSPLVRADIFGILNPVDRSFVGAPGVTWSAATNLDVLFIVLAFHGADLTEFGGMGTSAFARMRWAF